MNKTFHVQLISWAKAPQDTDDNDGVYMPLGERHKVEANMDLANKRIYLTDDTALMLPAEAVGHTDLAVGLFDDDGLLIWQQVYLKPGAPVVHLKEGWGWSVPA